jgi:hypothetical protein
MIDGFNAFESRIQTNEKNEYIKKLLPKLTDFKGFITSSLTDKKLLGVEKSIGSYVPDKMYSIYDKIYTLLTQICEIFKNMNKLSPQPQTRRRGKAKGGFRKTRKLSKSANGVKPKHDKQSR